MTVAYCAECDWERRTADGYSRDELNREMIDHYAATGHSPIEATELPERASWTDDPQPTA